MIKKVKTGALIVVDVQNDFCPGGSLAVEHGDEVIPVINRLMPLFARVVATQDWHPADHVSFAASHPGKKPLDAITHRGKEQVLWPVHCVQATNGSALHPDLDQRHLHLLVHKGMDPQLDSYSAFFENDNKTQTGLHGYLRVLGITELYFCGLATDYCVFASARDALGLGFTVTVIRDACRGVDFPQGSVVKALDSLQKQGAALVDSGDLEHA
jgi:nicotinamidase/pyrazinamidase